MLSDGNVNSLVSTLREEFAIKLKQLGHLTPRAIYFSTVKNKIKVAIGMRRSGKTSLVLLHIQHLIASGVPASRILYINFEDDRLLPMQQQQLAALLDAFYTLYPENHEQECYLFLDEIQNVDGWPLVVRRFFDSKLVEIYLTGSSAKLLSKEIASSLRGRSLATEVWPFSFKEYLSIKNFDYNKNQKSKITLDKLKMNFMEYLKTGGFPETINQSDSDRQQTLQEYVQVVTLRDIIERHNIVNQELMKYLIKYLLSNSASSFSVNKLFNDLKSQGYSVTRDTLYNYIAYVEDACLSFSVQLYSDSLRKTQVNPRKIYAVDPGLITAYTFGQQRNLGRLFETIVYLDLRRAGCSINYYLTKERYEVDFLAKSLQGEYQLIQVCWSLADKKTYEREHRALDAACNELKLPGKIVTLESYLEAL